MDNERLWLLARLYIVLRHGYITSFLESVYAELGAVLSSASSLDIVTAEDETILGHFNPAQSEPESGQSGEEAKG